MNVPIKAKIAAASRSVPEKIMTNFDLEKIVDTSDHWIKTRTGISQRHIVSENEASSNMSTKIAIQLLDKSGIKANDIDAIIVGTVTPDHLTPSTAAIVQKNINAKNAWGFDLSAACSGFIFGLETGASLIQSGKYKNVIVIGVDTMTSILDYEDRDTCVIFGDGGGGVLLQPSINDGIIDSLLRMDGTGGEYLIIPGGGSKIPASVDSVRNRDHYIKQDGKTVFKHAVRGMANVSQEILNNNNLTGDDIALFIPHQANKRIIDAAAEKCGISKEKVLINIDNYGNTTAGTIPIALSEAIDDGKIKQGDYILLSSFGAGFTWGSILIKWEN